MNITSLGSQDQDPVEWAKKLENASKSGILYASIGNDYRKLSIKEIDAISNKIIYQNSSLVDPFVSVEIKMHLRRLIKVESANLSKTAEKTNSWWMNAVIYISFATILFIPLGKYFQNKQAEAINQANDEIKDLAKIKESITFNKDEKAIVKRSNNKRSEFQKLKAEKLNNEIKNFKGDEESGTYKALLKQKNEAELNTKALNTTKEIEASNNSKLTKGIKNGGNTCYINSALQPLLAIKDFSNLMPTEVKKLEEESDEDYANRREVFEGLKTFLDAWDVDAEEGKLMKLVNSWRSAFHKAGLLQGEHETSMQTSGIIFDMVLQMAGKTYEMKTVKAYDCPDRSKYEISDAAAPEAIVRLTSGSSIQERIEELRKGKFYELTEEDNAYQHDKFGPLRKYTETTKILDKEPKELLVFDVATYENGPVAYKINPVADLYIDASGLFKDDVVGKANYKLVGFAQNHHEFHWTSVVLKDNAWQYCSDETVYKIDSTSSEFKYPASYMVYQKI